MNQPVERRLAAILAADVAGYSRLMGADEEGTHESFKAHFQQLINPKINEHQGRVVKTPATVRWWNSPASSTRCAARRRSSAVCSIAIPTCPTNAASSCGSASISAT